jgi:transcription antitermination factor NusG
VGIEKKWYVIYTKPRWEKKVAEFLSGKKIEHYCPLNKTTKYWTDRKKILLEPLFKGYVFVRLSALDKWDIKLIPGVINYIYWVGKPAVVKDEDIDTIRKFLNEFDDVMVVNKDITENKKVKVKQGIMMNYKGIVLQIKDNKAIVQIESMGVFLTATFEKSNLEKVES